MASCEGAECLCQNAGLKDRAARAAGPGQVGGSRDCVRSKVKPGVGQASRVSIIAESGQGSPVETRTFFH